MTIRELSQKTNLSTTTICKALKDPKSVKPQTYAILEKAMSTSDMSINKVYVILPDLKTYFFSLVLGGIISELTKLKIAPIVYVSNDRCAVEDEIFETIENSSEVGVIWVPAGETRVNQQILLKKKFKLVVAIRDSELKNIAFKVLLDSYSITKQATALLMKGGAKNPLLLNGHTSASTACEREQGFRDLLKESYHINDPIVLNGEYNTEQMAYDISIETIINNKIDGVITGNQMLTYAMLQAIQNSGLSIPKDISMVAFDYIPALEYYSSPITMIDIPTFEIGCHATEILMNLDAPSIIHKFQGTLHVLGSDKKW